jgi:phosphomannomutase / phosphoglucomutase
MTCQIVLDIPENIFRAYDIRGVVEESFTPNSLYTIGLALGSEAKQRGHQQFVVGRDGRLSGPVLVRALIDGILASGCDVTNVGEVPTPLVYYATKVFPANSAAVLTGSHNPPNYNGVKMIIGDETLAGEDIMKLYRRIKKQDFVFGKGREEKVEIIENYLIRVTSDVKLARPLKIVIDCGNGVGGKVAPRLFKKLGCEVIELFCEVDGNFPNHHPDPSEPKNLKDLILAVKKHQADLGLGFDGDADRVGVVTEEGEVIAADRLLMLLGSDILKKYPHATILYDVKATKYLPQYLKKLGGNPVMVRTGHSFLKAKIKETNAELAGEVSGHIFYNDGRRWFGFDDGLDSAARFLEVISQGKKAVGKIFSKLPSGITTPELKLPISEEEKFSFMEKFIARASFSNGEITTIDGLRVDFSDGFGLIRPSNTTPFLILRFEGDNEKALQRIENLFRKELLAVDPNLKLPW